MFKDTSMMASSRDMQEKNFGPTFELSRKKRELAKYESKHKRRQLADKYRLKLGIECHEADITLLSEQ